MSSRLSREKITKVATPLAISVGSAAVGSYLRGRKARRNGRKVHQLVQATNARAEKRESENRQLRHELAHDDLTGLKSKKAFIERGNQKLSRATPDQVFALAIFDLDNFKAINDNHPDKYDEGDRTLKSFAKVLLRSVRSKDNSPDLLAHGSRDDDDAHTTRLSGDEFAGLFEITPRTEMGKAMSPEERISVFCDRIRAETRQEFSGRPDLDRLGGVDVSIGVVIIRPGDTMEGALSQAAIIMGEEKKEHHAQNGAYRS